MTGYVHIGAPKCGSSTIQNLVEQNAQAIRDSGIAVSDDASFGNQLAHRFVSGWLSEDALDKSDVYDTFLKEHADDDIFISSEAYLALAKDPHLLEQLLTLLGQRELRVLAIIRNPAALLESTWFQWMRTYRTFPKVRGVMDQRGLYYKKYLNSDWFETIDRNWERWRTAPQVVDFTAIRMDLVEHFDPPQVLEEFLGRRIGFAEQKQRVNESMNGVTFRLLKDFRDVHFSDYRGFVRALDAVTTEKGYGKYRFLSDRMAAEITREAGRTGLFAPYLEVEPVARANAQELEGAVYEQLLQEARALAESFARSANSVPG